MEFNDKKDIVMNKYDSEKKQHMRLNDNSNEVDETSKLSEGDVSVANWQD